MNVRLSPEYFNTLGDRAVFIEGYTSDNWMNDWEMVSAPLLSNGRPDMTQVSMVTCHEFDWTGTPFEGHKVSVEDLLNLTYWMGNLTRAFKLLPGVF